MAPYMSCQNEKVKKGRGGVTYLRLLTFNTFHLAESVIQSKGTLVKSFPDRVVLLVVQVKAGLTLLGRVHHHFEQTLPDNRGTEHDTDELVDLGSDQGVKANQLKVTTTLTTLANHALRHTVEGGQFDIVVLATNLLLELAETLLERGELAHEDVGLVDLIGNDHELLLCSEIEDVLDILWAQRGTRWVAWVDDDDGTDINTRGLGLGQRLTDGVDISTPGLLFLQVVRHALRIQQRQSGRVERVLRDGNEDTGVRTVANHIEKCVDTRRCTTRAEEILRVCGEPITLLDESSNTLPDNGCSLTMTVGAHTVNILQESLGTLNDILLVAKGCLEGLGVFQQQRVLDQTQHLTEEGDGLLVQLLRVANVRKDHTVKGQRLVSLCELHTQFLGLDGQLTTHGILGFPHVGVDVVQVQGTARMGSQGLFRGMLHGGLGLHDALC